MVDVAACGGAAARWKVPAVGAAAGPIALNVTACLGIQHDGAVDAVVLSTPCGAAASKFAVQPNGSITHSGLCLDALPTLRMAACAASSFSQKWSTDGGAIKLVTTGEAGQEGGGGATSIPSPTNLWQFDAGTDALLGVNTGSIGNPPLTCTGTCTRATAAAGHRGHGWSPKGHSFLGNGDGAVPAGVPLGNDPYTVAAWIRPDSAATTRMAGVVGWGDWESVDGSNGFATGAKSSFYNYWFSKSKATSSVDMLFPTPGIGQDWGHFLCKWDGTKKSCYWNGKLAKSQLVKGGHKAQNGFFRIGSTHKGEFWSGVMDDVAIFDTALPDAAIPHVMLGDFNGSSGVCVRASAIPQPAPRDPNSHAQMLDVPIDLTVGVVVEASLSCDTQKNSTISGFAVQGSSGSAQFLWNCATQVFQGTAGTINRATDFPADAPIELKLLLRTTPDGDIGM
eukprot:COSAG01_NODE_6050_length_3880_cov_4.660970_5_plen_450_part_01